MLAVQSAVTERVSGLYNWGYDTVAGYVVSKPAEKQQPTEQQERTLTTKPSLVVSDVSTTDDEDCLIIESEFSASASEDESSLVPSDSKFAEFAEYDYGVEQWDNPQEVQIPLVAYNFCIHCKVEESAGCCHLVNGVIRMLLVVYPPEDVESILVLTLANLDRIRHKLEGMGSLELTMVTCAEMFTSHCLIEDDYIPLRVWHKKFFLSYCSLNSLQKAVLKLMSLRDYQSIPSDEMTSAAKKTLYRRAPGIPKHPLRRRTVSHEIDDDPTPIDEEDSSTMHLALLSSVVAARKSLNSLIASAMDQGDPQK